MPKHLLLAVGVSIFVLSLLACGGSSTSNTGAATNSTPSPAGHTPTTASASHFKVGQVVKVGDTWQVTVNSARGSSGGQYSKPQKAGDRFLIFQVTVKNISAQEQSISGLAQFNVTDTTGQKYTASYDDEAGPSLDGKVEAGAPLKGSLTYEAPTSVHDFQLAFEAQMFSSGQTIWDIHI